MLIHGLKGRPNIWYRQLNELRKNGQYEIRAPKVYHRGKCSISAAADPIFKMIADYASKNPGKPICLMGVSNGGRIALELEYRLRHVTRNPVKLSIVAGQF